MLLVGQGTIGLELSAGFWLDINEFHSYLTVIAPTGIILMIPAPIASQH